MRSQLNISQPRKLLNSASNQEKLYSESIVGDQKTYHCLVPDCGKSFKFKSEMKRHLAIHSNQRPYVCAFPGCDKSFKRNDALINHARIHNKNTPFQCPEDGCGLYFPTKSALRYHVLKHKGDKPFKCSHPGCPKSFLTQAQLKQHEKASYYHQKVERMVSPDYEQPLLSIMPDDSLPEEIFGSTDISEGHEANQDTNNFSSLKAWEESTEAHGDESRNAEDLVNLYKKYSEDHKGDDARSAAASEELSTASKRNMKETFISILSYMMEENNQLRKKLKTCNESLKECRVEVTQIKVQIKDKDEVRHLENRDDIDYFLKSTFGLEFKRDDSERFENFFSTGCNQSFQ